MSTERMKLTDYLPPEQRQKVFKLVERLQEETESKSKYMQLYQQTKKQLEQVNEKYGKLKDQNDYLRKQIHNSFSIVSQVRANFKANKQKQVEKEQDEWEDDSEQDENKARAANFSTQQHPPRPIMKSPLDKYRPQQTPNSKKDSSVLNISGSYLNQTNLSGSKSKQVEDLRRQVKALQEEKKRKELKDKEYHLKQQLVNQIKSRYKGNPDRSKSPIIERIDISDTFDQEQFKDKESAISRQKSEEKIAVPKLPTHVSKEKKMEIQPKEKISIIQPPNKQMITATKKKVVTAEDYGEVLDLINCYNL